MSSQHYHQISPKAYAAHLAQFLTDEEIEPEVAVDYSQYQTDPVCFGQMVLGETYTDEVKVLMESVRDNVITVAVSANATGKTHAAARIAAWFKKAFPNSQVYTGAAPPESNLKKLLWGEIMAIAESQPDLFKGDSITNLHIQTSAKEFLTGVTIPSSGTEAQREAKFSGKHAPYLMFILDEGDAIPDEVYRGIESCMSGGHVRLLVMFNPRAEVGEAYRMIRDGRANVVTLSAFNHPNVVTGEDVIPGAVTRETTVRRINEWCRPLVDEHVAGDCFELPDFLIECVAQNQRGIPYPPLKAGFYKIMESAFSYMVLGQYPAQGVNQLISKEWVSAARSRWDLYVAEHGEKAPVGTMGVMGQDVGEFGNDPSVSGFRYGGYVERFIQWSGVDPLVTGDKAADEYKKRDIIQANVDATGVGSGVAPAMTRLGCRAFPVKVASRATVENELGVFNIMRDQLWWSTREWLRTDSGAMLPPDEELLEELRTPTYEIRNGRIWVMDKDTMKELLRRSPNKADALSLTFYESGSMFDPLDIDACAS